MLGMSTEYPVFVGLDEDNRHGDPALERWEVSDGVVLVGVHSREGCEVVGDRCVLHNPTNHHMSDCSLLWRGDRGIFERICEHGVGHPDPDQFDYWKRSGSDSEGVHGCDGCCAPHGSKSLQRESDAHERLAKETSAAKAETALVRYRMEFLLRRLNRASEMGSKTTLDEWEVGTVALLIDRWLE